MLHSPKFIQLSLICLLFIIEHITVPTESFGQETYADKIFFGGDIITVDNDNPVAQAIAVFQGKIIAIGSEQDIFKLASEHTNHINLQGYTLMPGFIDAHTHPILSALMGQTIDVSGFSNKSEAEVMTSLKEGIKKASKGDWIFAVKFPLMSLSK